MLPPSDWEAHDPVAATLVDLDTPADVEGDADRRASTPVGLVRVQVLADEVHTTSDRDRLAPEEPLLVRARGPGEPAVDVVTTLRSPGHEADLAIGWLFTEGLYDPSAGAATTRIGDPVALSRPEDTITVDLPHPLPLAAAAHRHTMATASCGVCGRASIDELAARCAPVPSDAPGTRLSLAWLLGLPASVRSSQPIFAATGGVHATALFSAAGELLTVREDVGRHNALDAAIGTRLRSGHDDADAAVAVLSGRIGFELVAKAAVARIPVVVAVGAPTDLAVRTADRLGVTLLGFVRDGRGNVYTHGGRLTKEADTDGHE